MNFISWVIVAVLIVLVVLDVRYIRKHGLEDCEACGGSCGCSGGCSGCGSGSSCKWTEDIKKARAEIRKADTAN